jgi:hypothetical protein
MPGEDLGIGEAREFAKEAQIACIEGAPTNKKTDHFVDALSLADFQVHRLGAGTLQTRRRQ